MDRSEEHTSGKIWIEQIYVSVRDTSFTASTQKYGLKLMYVNDVSFKLFLLEVKVMPY